MYVCCLPHGLQAGEESGWSDQFNYIHFGDRLFQEWVVILWKVAENIELNYLSQNQKALRADTYQNMRQQVEATRQPDAGSRKKGA